MFFTSKLAWFLILWKAVGTILSTAWGCGIARGHTQLRGNFRVKPDIGNRGKCFNREKGIKFHICAMVSTM